MKTCYSYVFESFDIIILKGKSYLVKRGEMLYPDLAIPLMISIQYRQRTSIRYTRWFAQN